MGGKDDLHRICLISGNPQHAMWLQSGLGSRLIGQPFGSLGNSPSGTPEDSTSGGPVHCEENVISSLETLVNQQRRGYFLSTATRLPLSAMARALVARGKNKNTTRKFAAKTAFSVLPRPIGGAIQAA
jgi:hypothetical protein